MGEFVPNASNGIDTYCIREPLGVCAGICPSNFPAMIPLWVCLPASCFLSWVLVHPLSCLDIGCCKLLNIIMLPSFCVHHLLGYLCISSFSIPWYSDSVPEMRLIIVLQWPFVYCVVLACLVSLRSYYSNYETCFVPVIVSFLWNLCIFCRCFLLQLHVAIHLFLSHARKIRVICTFSF